MIEVYLIFDVEFGYETGFTKEFKAKSTSDVLEKANIYMKSDIFEADVPDMNTHLIVSHMQY